MSSSSPRALRLFVVGVAVVLSACGERPPTAPSSNTPPADSSFNPASFREAGRITAVAGNEVLVTMRAGRYERDIKTLVDAVLSREGSGPPAFAHIVAAGPNAVDMHYAGDGGRLADGETLQIDIGATSNGHCSDMSRVYPVSGRFNTRQLELYELVLEAQQRAAMSARVGIDSISGLDSLVRAFFRASSLRAKDAGGAETTMDKFFTHLLGHYVGREVHGSDTTWGTWLPIQDGQCFTLEPGLYIASEGVGVRIEDTYLVSGGRLECLTCAAARDPSAVQRSQ